MNHTMQMSFMGLASMATGLSAAAQNAAPSVDPALAGLRQDAVVTSRVVTPTGGKHALITVTVTDIDPVGHQRQTIVKAQDKNDSGTIDKKEMTTLTVVEEFTASVPDLQKTVAVTTIDQRHRNTRVYTIDSPSTQNAGFVDNNFFQRKENRNSAVSQAPEYKRLVPDSRLLPYYVIK